MTNRVLLPLLVGSIAATALACEFSPTAAGADTDDPIFAPDASPAGPDAAPDPTDPDAALPDAALPDAALPDAEPPPDAAPPVLAFTSGANTTQHGNTSGGDAYDDACPAGEVLIGFSGELRNGNDWHSRIAGRCGAATLVPDGTGGFDIAITPATTLPTRGTAGGGSSWMRTCPADQIVVGFDGRSGALVDQIQVRCAPLLVTGSPGSLSFSRGSITDLQSIGGNGGSNFANADCPADQVAQIARVRAGDDLDAFGLGCVNATAD